MLTPPDSFWDVRQLFINKQTNLQMNGFLTPNLSSAFLLDFVCHCVHCLSPLSISGFQGTWECLLEDGDDYISSFCVVKVSIPKHFKIPKFLEDLKVALGENGNVSLECKVAKVEMFFE